MNDDRAKAYVNLYHDALVEDLKKCGDMRRTLALLVKSVERDTRHKASKVVQEAINKIHNLEYDNPPK